MQDQLILIQKSELLNIIDEMLENKFKTYFKEFTQIQPNKSSTDQPLLSIDDVQKQLKICKNKIFDLIKIGELKSIKLNRRRLFTQEALNNFIKQKSQR